MFLKTNMLLYYYTYNITRIATYQHKDMYVYIIYISSLFYFMLFMIMLSDLYYSINAREMFQ